MREAGIRSAYRDAVIGAIAGIVATAAMTLAAHSLFRRLPPAERYPLPPRELTEQAAARTGIRARMSETALQTATLAAHFGFGAGAGALYAPMLLPRSPPVRSGIVYALAVWAASYFGWVPALGLLRPASEHPARRNALMIAVHVVFGATLGFVGDRLRRALQAVSAGPVRDR